MAMKVCAHYILLFWTMKPRMSNTKRPNSPMASWGTVHAQVGGVLYIDIIYCVCVCVCVCV